MMISIKGGNQEIDLPVYSYVVLLFPALSYHALSYPALSCHAFSCQDPLALNRLRKYIHTDVCAAPQLPVPIELFRAALRCTVPYVLGALIDTKLVFSIPAITFISGMMCACVCVGVLV